MMNLIEIPLDDGASIYLEVAEEAFVGEGQFEAISNPDGVIRMTKKYLEGTLRQIRVFADNIAGAVKDLTVAPDEVELEFSVLFAAKAGVVVSSLSSEASVKIKLKWKNGAGTQ